MEGGVQWKEARREKSYLIEKRIEAPWLLYLLLTRSLILIPVPTMVPLSPTLFCFLFLPVLVLSATNSSNSDTTTCNPSHNGLASGTLQFTSDCNATTWCNNGQCQPKGCRKDQYPLGYNTGGSVGNGKHILPPPLCPSDKFCPDEGSECVDKIAVGQPCQFDRDGS